MPKLTDKYRRALMVAEKEQMANANMLNQEDLYLACNMRGYFWGAKEGIWAKSDAEKAEPPSNDIRIRIWTDAEIVEDIAGDVEAALARYGLRLLERSRVYPCRPPKQLDGRVYLAFGLPEKQHGKR